MMVLNKLEGNKVSSWNYTELKRHIGHDIVCVPYGEADNPVNVAVECETCNEVILDYDQEGNDD